MEEFIDSVVMGILNPIMSAIGAFFSFIFSSRPLTLLTAFLFMNGMGFLMMYLDKKYAEEKKRRISEFTLFITAILFGSLGIWAGMYKFRHKTLHKSFTIGIPLIIVIQVIVVVYNLIKGNFA